MALGHQFCLYMRPFNGDALNRQPRRRWLFLQPAPVLGVFCPRNSGPSSFPAPAPLAPSSIGTGSGSFGPVIPGQHSPQPRRRWLFRRSAPVLGVLGPEFRDRIPPSPGAAGSFADRHRFWEFGAPGFRGAALLSSPGAAGSFVDRHQFWGLCGPKIRGRIPLQPRRRRLFRRSAPVLGVLGPEFRGRILPQPRRRWLFRWPAPVLGVWRPGISGGRTTSQPRRRWLFVDRHQFWGLRGPKIRGRIPPQPRRRWLFRRLAPVLGVWFPGISGSHSPPAPAPLALSSIGANFRSSAPHIPWPIKKAYRRIY